MSIDEMIDQINDMAQAMLEYRRARSSPHRFGIWRGDRNPYSVGNPDRSSQMDW